MQVQYNQQKKYDYARYAREVDTPLIDNISEHPMIDNISEHPTPEGLMLTLIPAGMMPRLSAWLFDGLLRMVILVVVSMPLILFGDSGVGLYAIVTFLVNWLYPVYFEVRHNGMTPGKKHNGIYVCHDDGTPVSLQSSMIRNLLRVADFMPMLFMSGGLSMMFNRKSQRLGDMVAGTMVVYQEQDDIAKIYKSVYGLVSQPQYQANHLNNNTQPNPSVNQSVTHYDPSSPLFTFPLNLSEQQAMLSLADRLMFLPDARQRELTSYLKPLVRVNSINQMGVSHSSHDDMVYQAVLDRSSSLYI